MSSFKSAYPILYPSNSPRLRSLVLDCTPTSTYRPNAQPSPPPRSPPSSADWFTPSTSVGSWRRTGDTGNHRATRWARPRDQTRNTISQKRLALCPPSGGRGLAIRPDKQTAPIYFTIPKMVSNAPKSVFLHQIFYSISFKSYPA